MIFHGRPVKFKEDNLPVRDAASSKRDGTWSTKHEHESGLCWACCRLIRSPEITYDLIDMESGATQLIRLGYRGRMPAAKEKSWSLEIQIRW